MNLLTPGTSSPKLAKHGERYESAILYLASHNQADPKRTVCPMAERNGCAAPCLDYSGRGGFDPKVRAARIRKTRWYWNDRPAFMRQLHSELDKLEARADKKELTAVARPDGTSDLGLGLEVASEHPGVLLYDYTKVFARWKRWANSGLGNTHLTFSLGTGNRGEALQVLLAGHNVAVPFAGEFPAEFLGHQVINGDAHDWRFEDPSPVIVGLSAKGGSVKRDTLGFLQAA